MKVGDIVTLEEIIAELYDCVEKLDLYNKRNRFADMLHVCVRLKGYSEALRDISEELGNLAQQGIERDKESVFD